MVHTHPLLVLLILLERGFISSWRPSFAFSCSACLIVMNFVFVLYMKKVFTVVLKDFSQYFKDFVLLSTKLFPRTTTTTRHEKCATFLFVPLYIMCIFSSGCFKIFLFVPVLSRLIMMFIGMVFFMKMFLTFILKHN